MTYNLQNVWRMMQKEFNDEFAVWTIKRNYFQVVIKSNTANVFIAHICLRY